MGHIAVERRADDVFAGVCPFHGDCFEGMASGTAVAARFGRRAEALEGADRDAAISIIAFYLAVGVRSLVYALSPERIVVGGGLSAMPGSPPRPAPNWSSSSLGTQVCPNTASRCSSSPRRSATWQGRWAR